MHQCFTDADSPLSLHVIYLTLNIFIWCCWDYTELHPKNPILSWVLLNSQSQYIFHCRSPTGQFCPMWKTLLSFTAAAYLFYWPSKPKQFFFSCFMRKFKQERTETWFLDHFLFSLHSLCSLLFNSSLNEITLSFHRLFILDLLWILVFSPPHVFFYSCWSWSMNSWSKLRTTDKLNVIKKEFILMGNYATSVCNQ